MKQDLVVFPLRTGNASNQPLIPACRAWRILARPVSDFGSDKPAVIAGAIPQAPANALSGIYPVWVRATDPKSGKIDLGAPRLVDGDGWNTDPMGPDWFIQYVGLGGGLNTDVFTYIVEVIGPEDSLDICGQVDSPAIQSTYKQYDFRTSAPGQNFGLTNLICSFSVPPWAKSGEIWVQCGVLATGLGTACYLIDQQGRQIAPTKTSVSGPGSSTYLRYCAFGAATPAPGVALAYSFDESGGYIQGGIMPAVIVFTMTSGSMNPGQLLTVVAIWSP